MLGLGFSLALVAGFFAANASVFSKLAFEEEGATLRRYACVFVIEELCNSVSIAHCLPHCLSTGCVLWWSALCLICAQFVLLLRVGCFFLLLLSNALMWTLFVKALQGCGSTVEAAVANSASNFICTVCLSIVALVLSWLFQQSFTSLTYQLNHSWIHGPDLY